MAEESKIRKILVNEIFIVIALLSAIFSPVYTLFSIKTDIALLQQRMSSAIESFDKMEDENNSYHKEILDLNSRLTKVEAYFENK